MRLLVLALGAGLLVAGPAGAHGVLERSSPTAGASIELPPPQVVLWFNEPVDPALSFASVVDPSGKRLSGPPVLSPDRRQMTLSLGDLPRGFYTVRWRVLSAVDGHTTAGTFVFTVGLGVRPPAVGGRAGPDPPLIIVRWAGYLAALLLAGSVLFRVLVHDPGLRGLQPAGPPGLEVESHRRLRAVQVGAAATVVAAAAGELVVRAAALADAPLAQVIVGGTLAQLLWGTKVGWSALSRAAFAALLLLPSTPGGRILRLAGLGWLLVVGAITAMFGGPAALAGGGGHLALVVLVATVYGLAAVMAAILLPQVPDLRVPMFAWVPPVAAAGVLAGLVVNSHAVGSGPLAVAADWLHLLAAAVWGGGLATLLVLVAGPRDEARALLARSLVPRYSRLAAAALGLLVATGLYSAWLHVPGLRALWESGYGRALAVKLALVVPLVALGAVSRFVIRPRLEGTPPGEAGPLRSRFIQVAAGEVSLAAAVLLGAAVLTALPPARVTQALSPAVTALRLAGRAGDALLTLLVDPARPGPNRFEVTLAGRDGRPLDVDGRVLVRLGRLDEDLTPATLVLDRRGGGRYLSEGRPALPEGWWEVEAVVRRRGALDAAVSFPLRLGQPVAQATDPAAARLLEASLAAMAVVPAWREVEQIADGAGGVLVAEVELVRPDRLRFRTSAGTEGVIIGATRFLREGGGPWRRDVLRRPLSADGALQYLRGAEAVAPGRLTRCDEEPCRVVLWEAPDRSASFAGWIGTETGRLHRLFMVAPAHFMTLRTRDVGAPLRIDPPE